MLWVKAFHVFFVVAWFAGLFYLPRLFVYHTQVTAPEEHARFSLMERRLYGMATFGMIGTWLLGLSLVVMTPAYLQMHWLHAKLTIVVLLSGYHGWLKVNLRRFAAGTNRRTERFWRFANEVPAVALIAIVILVIVKPF